MGPCVRTGQNIQFFRSAVATVELQLAYRQRVSERSYKEIVGIVNKLASVVEYLLRVEKGSSIVNVKGLMYSKYVSTFPARYLINAKGTNKLCSNLNN